MRRRRRRRRRLFCLQEPDVQALLDSFCAHRASEASLSGKDFEDICPYCCRLVVKLWSLSVSADADSGTSGLSEEVAFGALADSW